jgi:AraC family transcriptional regulator
MRVAVADVAGMRLAGLWHRGTYERIRETFATLFPRMEALGLDQLPDSTLVAVYYDDPDVTPSDELRSFAAVTIAEGVPIGDLHEVRLPGGRFLRGEFIGPHDQIPEAWTKLGERLAEGSYTSRAAESFEVYVGNDEGDPSDQDRTDLPWPVA